MSEKLIKPQTLKGFRDFLPSAALARERLIDTAKRVYRSYGYAPIDTPALEYTEILLGKGGDESDKQMFRFEDQGGRDVAMRFDLTVPFARFAAQHAQELGLPFKRYHVGTVWRGERPQKGRFREFVQCDFDTIGTDSAASDAETLLVIHDLLVALGIERFSIRVNHRGVLNGLLESLGVRDKSASVLRALDKLAKAGREAVIKEMVEIAGLTSDAAESILRFCARTGPPGEVLSEVATQLDGVEISRLGIQTLRGLFEAADAAGVPASRLRLDLAIARGLDYYTGTIYETFLDDLPAIGSVCSGGRYDNLAGLFTKLPLPGVGASLGVDRLLAAMEELGLVADGATPATVLMTQFEPNRLRDYIAAAARLRGRGIAVEVFPEAKNVGKQFKYADRKGHRLVIVAGSDEFAARTWQIKTLATGEQTTVADTELVDAVSQLLNPG
ncbi:MAG: histidine--tRNA ligase [Planctomycetaceae bacterium]|nr:histidine--tRNA ligase [Planctomycetaceae bacterium]